MARKLGETLIEEGLLDARRLQEALRSQRIFGGSLGSNLLQLGFIDEESLGRVLGKVYGVPVAQRIDLLGASPEVVKLLPTEFTKRHRALPFKVEGHRLHLALQNPADSLAVHEAAFLTGFQVVPHVASESVLRDALAHHHRGDGSSSRPGAATMTGAFQAMPAQPGHETGPVRVITSPQETPADSRPQRGTGASDGALAPLPHPRSPEFSAPPARDASTGPHPQRGGGSEPPRGAAPRGAMAPSAPAAPQATASLATFGRELAGATSRDEILRALLDEVARMTPRSIVFVVKGDEAVATLFRGVDVGQRRLALPLDRPSVLDAVREESPMSYGPVALTAANQDFYILLGGRVPRVAFVLPVYVRKRAVVALYGDDPTGSALPPDFRRARRIAALGGWAIEALVLRGKILRESGAEGSTPS